MSTEDFMHSKTCRHWHLHIKFCTDVLCQCNCEFKLKQTSFTVLSYAIYSDLFVNMFFIKFHLFVNKSIPEYSQSGKANIFYIPSLITKQPDSNDKHYFCLFHSALYLVLPLTSGLPVLCYVGTPWLASELPAACSGGTAEHTVWRTDSSGNPTDCPDYPWSGPGCHGWLVSWGTVRTI